MTKKPMKKTLQPPVRGVQELFDFLAGWYDLSGPLPTVDVPAETPLPLRALYQRFGSTAAEEWWVRPDLCWSKGMFSGQNFLSAPSRLGKESTVEAGQRYWLIVQENQGGWFAWIPVGNINDLMVAYTAAHDRSGAQGFILTSIPLSQFLATHVLVETIFASPRLWCIGARPFHIDEFRLQLLPLLSGSMMGDPPRFGRSVAVSAKHQTSFDRSTRLPGLAWTRVRAWHLHSTKLIDRLVHPRISP
jgi:hypothetical protein